ncbi:MAG: hypothetical protein QOG65_810, partial [Actinomycetota bacterium]|nr:hypothetical protein [Actinomycetota bacterium]
MPDLDPIDAATADELASSPLPGDTVGLLEGLA